MSWIGASKDPLSAVALRAFRSPVSGLATMLAAIASEMQAQLAAAYLLPVEGRAELVATGGPQAGLLGPPGYARASVTDALRSHLSNRSPDPVVVALAGVPPWQSHQHVSCLPIMMDGSFNCMLAVGSDNPTDPDDLYSSSAAVGLLAQMVVYRREVERLRQELHDLQQDRSLLTAGLHHDIKGPLTSILGSARTLVTRDDELDDETKLDLLAGVAMQSERLARMLADTLERQASDPNAPLRMMRTPLADLANRVALAASSGRQGEVVVEAGELCIVTDSDRLERALLNLVDNALKYSPADIPVYVLVEDEGAAVAVTVADNGPGVSSDVLPALFSAYATDPTRSDGTGLGLHSVRSLVEELKGRVGYSRHSDWTRFTITLPKGEGC